MTPVLWLIGVLALLALAGLAWVACQLDAMLDEQQAELMERMNSDSGGE